MKIWQKKYFNRRWISKFLIVGLLVLSFTSDHRGEGYGDNKVISVKSQVKPDKPWTENATLILQNLGGFSLDSTDRDIDQFGGRSDKKHRATGFFRTEKIGDRWWIIDPIGNCYYNKALVSVTIGKSKTSQEEVKNIFGDELGWADSTSSMLWEHGFNGTGAWSDENIMFKSKPRLPYAIVWNFMSGYGKERGGTFQQPGHTGYPEDCIFVFDPGFEKFCDKLAKKLAQTKDDQFLLGHFSDNEMPFPEDALDNYLRLDTNENGYKAALEWLRNRQGGECRLSDITKEDRELFLELVAERYFSIISEAIKRYDPNHMFLGARFHSNTMDRQPVMKAAGKYLDIISINYYYAWTPDVKRMQKWAEWSGRPFIITEWYVKGADAGLPNKSGAGWIVPTQLDRGYFYQNFTLGLLPFKSCVGWQWFKYIDNDPKAKGVDPSNNDSNKGIVTIKFEKYSPLLEKMKELNSRVYRLIDFFDGDGK